MHTYSTRRVVFIARFFSMYADAKKKKKKERVEEMIEKKKKRDE